MTTTIDLLDPVQWHAERVTRIELKPPTAGMLLNFGEPRIVVRNADGAIYFVEKDDVIRKYIDRCVTHEGGSDLVSVLSLVDGKRIKAAMLGFFTDADMKSAAADKKNADEGRL